MKRVLLAMGACAALFLATGCDDDRRRAEERIPAPAPDFNTRHVMACPVCGAPQRPFRITAMQSYYRCSGQPPKFPFHTEERWTHHLDEKRER